MRTVKRLRISLGTLVAVEATSTSAAASEAAVEAAFAALAQIGHRLHPHSADSDLARINNAPLQTRITVHSSTCDLLNLAQRLNTLTDGVFDPCLPSRAGRLHDVRKAMPWTARSMRGGATDVPPDWSMLAAISECLVRAPNPSFYVDRRAN